jgi:hypothetical protein
MTAPEEHPSGCTCLACRFIYDFHTSASDLALAPEVLETLAETAHHMPLTGLDWQSLLDAVYAADDDSAAA